MGLQHVAPLIENDTRELVMKATWGHLAPEKNKTYRGKVIWALGCGYNYSDLNPTVLLCDFEELPDSPWFYDALIDFLQELVERGTGVWQWEGTFRNYSWCGKLSVIPVAGLNNFSGNALTVPKMSKQDFDRIAGEVRALPANKKEKRIKELLSELRASNPKFNEKKFRKACLAK